MSAPRKMTPRERRDADARARQPQTIWLPEPIVDPVSGRKIVGFEKGACPVWLQELLAAIPDA
jgi:hypothetical protein